MIDHRSMINQRIETPVGRQHGDRDSDELAPLPPPFLNGASTSAEKTDDPHGELMVTDLIANRELIIPLFQSVVGQAS